VQIYSHPPTPDQAALLWEQAVERPLTALADFRIWPVGGHEPKRDRQETPAAAGRVNPWLVVSNREMTVRGEDDNRFGTDGIRTVVGFPFKPVAALISRRSRDERGERAAAPPSKP
jgi:hypothetical protein